MDATQLSSRETLCALQSGWRPPPSSASAISNSSGVKCRTETEVKLGYLQQLGEWRGRKSDWDPARHFEANLKFLKRRQKLTSAIPAILERHLPKSILDRVALLSYGNGVIRVLVDSASTHYELRSELSAGAFARIQREFKGSLTDIKARIGVLEAGAPASPTRDGERWPIGLDEITAPIGGG